MEGTIYLSKGQKNVPTQDQNKIEPQPPEEPEKADFNGVAGASGMEGQPQETKDQPQEVQEAQETQEPEEVKEFEPVVEQYAESGVQSKHYEFTPTIIQEPARVAEVEDKTTAKNLLEPFRKYVKRFKEAVIEENKRAPNPIYVDEIATRVAKFYELVRRIIDWKEEHLIRRIAIERILKRRLVTEIYGISILPDVNSAEMAEPFVLELVRSGYFENGKIPQEKIPEIQKVLDKYIYILKNGPIKNGNGAGRSKKEAKASIKKKINFYNWILEIASCEIEEILDVPLREYALLDLMTECLCQRIQFVPERGISDDEKYLQVYIAVHRTLFNLDEPIISFHVLKHKYPDFFASEDFIPVFTEKVLEIWEEIEKDLNHPKASEFYRIAEKYDVAYLMIGDSMNKLDKNVDEIDEKISDPNVLLTLSEKSYKERLATLKIRLLKLAVFSTLSIFVAGSVSLVIFEIPIANLVHGRFFPWAIVADIGIPTALMFILVWMIKPPAVDNLSAVKEEVDKIAYLKDELDVYEIRLNKRVKKIMNFIFALIYLAGGLASLYFIYWVFMLAGVPWTSLYIDTVNVAMIVFAAMVIRQRAKELTIIEKDNAFEFILDFFSIPLAKIGSWFSQKWKEYNIVSVFFTALIDFPFSSFVATIEGWRNFIKEKRSELH